MRDDDGRCAARSKWDQPTIASRSSSSFVSLLPLSLFAFSFFPAPCSGTVPSRYFIPSRPSLSFSSFLFAVLFLLYLIIEPTLFLFFSSFSIHFFSHFVSFYPFYLSFTITPGLPASSYPLAAAFAPSFRLSCSFTLFLSSSLLCLYFLALLFSPTNYLCLISDTVDAKRQLGSSR